MGRTQFEFVSGADWQRSVKQNQPPHGATQIRAGSKGDHSVARNGMATILVVDDEPMILKLCGNILSGDGHEVLPASNGQEALELLRSNTVDLALLDVIMPGMDGIFLADRIQLLNQDTRVILMSGCGSREITQVAGKENPYRIIWKPFKAESLLRMIGNVLGESEAASD